MCAWFVGNLWQPSIRGPQQYGSDVNNSNDTLIPYPARSQRVQEGPPVVGHGCAPQAHLGDLGGGKQVEALLQAGRQSNGDGGGGGGGKSGDGCGRFYTRGHTALPGSP